MTEIPPQPTVVVAGDPGAGLRPVAGAFFAERTRHDEGAVVVATRRSAAVVELVVEEAGLDPGRTAVVDAGVEGSGPARGRTEGWDDGEGSGDGWEDGEGSGDGPAAVSGNGDPAEPGWYRRVDPAAPAETMDDAVADAFGWLAEAGVERRHFLYDGLGGAPAGVDEYERAFALAMTVGAEDGLAMFTLDERAFGADEVAEFSHLVDVSVELREDAGSRKLRWTGLLGASDGWVGLGEADLGVGGLR